MSLLELFCKIDDFWQSYEPIWYQSVLESGQQCRRRHGRMSMSEMLTLVVHFHQKWFRDFKPITQRMSQFTYAKNFQN